MWLETANCVEGSVQISLLSLSPALLPLPREQPVSQDHSSGDGLCIQKQISFRNKAELKLHPAPPAASVCIFH